MTDELHQQLGLTAEQVRPRLSMTVERGLTAMRRAQEAGKKFHPPVGTGAAGCA